MATCIVTGERNKATILTGNTDITIIRHVVRMAVLAVGRTAGTGFDSGAIVTDENMSMCGFARCG